MATINKYGVITDPEVVVLASGHTYHLEAIVAEHKGMWYAGATYNWGGVLGGACGGGWSPWVSNNPITPQPTRQEAIDRVAEWIGSRIRLSVRDYTTSVGAPVHKSARLALRDLEAYGAPKQMTMF